MTYLLVFQKYANFFPFQTFYYFENSYGYFILVDPDFCSITLGLHMTIYVNKSVSILRYKLDNIQ